MVSPTADEVNSCAVISFWLPNPLIPVKFGVIIKACNGIALPFTFIHEACYEFCVTIVNRVENFMLQYVYCSS
jgi:hypothetical protein